MFYHENEYLNYHFTTIVNVNNLTFRCTILSNDVIFSFKSLCYVQIKFRDYKLISLGTAVENIHANIKNLQNFTFYCL